MDRTMRPPEDNRGERRFYTRNDPPHEPHMPHVLQVGPRTMRQAGGNQPATGGRNRRGEKDAKDHKGEGAGTHETSRRGRGRDPTGETGTAQRATGLPHQGDGTDGRGKDHGGAAPRRTHGRKGGSDTTPTLRTTPLGRRDQGKDVRDTKGKRREGRRTPPESRISKERSKRPKGRRPGRRKSERSY
jgi:hypothetical protein